MLRGLDGSSVQGLLAFGALKAAGYRFVICKAQQGNDGFDPDCVANVKAAIEYGIEPFVYCFCYPLPKLDGHPGRDPLEQAKIFADRLKAKFGDLLSGRPIFVDMEWPAPEKWAANGCSAKQIAEWMRVFCAELERLTGCRVVIYTYPYWWKAILDGGGNLSWASAYGLWLAAYVKAWPVEGQHPDCSFTFGKGISLPPPWSEWTFWQWDGNGGQRLPNGVDADFCVFNGDEDALQAFITPPQPDRPVDSVEGNAAIDEVST